MTHIIGCMSVMQQLWIGVVLGGLAVGEEPGPDGWPGWMNHL